MTSILLYNVKLILSEIRPDKKLKCQNSSLTIKCTYKTKGENKTHTHRKYALDMKTGNFNVRFFSPNLRSC